MNATEDGEPLGESPAIDTLTAIGRGAVAGMLAGADYAKAITAVRGLHTENYFRNCGCCREPWPCGTILAIDSAGA